MSGSRAKLLRRAAGNPVKAVKVKTPLLDRSYIQAPVAFEFGEGGWQYRYRSPKRVRKFLQRNGVDVETLETELKQWMADYTAMHEAVPAANG